MSPGTEVRPVAQRNLFSRAGSLLAGEVKEGCLVCRSPCLKCGGGFRASCGNILAKWHIDQSQFRVMFGDESTKGVKVRQIGTDYYFVVRRGVLGLAVSVE